MAVVLGVVQSVTFMTADESNQLLAFDYGIHLIQSRLPILLAGLALFRDIFGNQGTTCYPPPEYVTNTEVVKYLNSYCIYETDNNAFGSHQFIPFTFTMQAVFIQIPIFMWIACGGKTMSTVAKWFSKCCRVMCSEAEVSHQTENKGSTSNEDWPEVHSIIQSYINEWSASNKYVVIYFILKVTLWMFILISFVYHYLLLFHAKVEFGNDEFLCEIKYLNETINCVNSNEIFNQILIIIDLLMCLTIPLILLICQDVYLFISMWCGCNDNIAEFIPYLEIPKETKKLNNINLLTLYYKENIELKDKYFQKILIPWLSKLETDEFGNPKRVYKIPPPSPKPKCKA
ncbi:uncharacterized protein LOC117107757 [Anneissia japonica]|uniref:uncharacterized protein LOC117107757 n=1 Tax=Anneissia japonica TaxID=1529436 RepID=UPI001425623E|nr:uncharacterized protein LOC117107757 [Anneissia japonica]